MASRRMCSGRCRGRGKLIDEIPAGRRQDPVVGNDPRKAKFLQGGQSSRSVATDGTSLADLGVVIRGILDIQVQQSVQMQVVVQALFDRNQTPDGKVEGVRDFAALKPREFLGTESVVDAHEWFEHIETILIAAVIPEAQRVDVVQIQFMGNARAWYDSELSRIGGAFGNWQDFKRSFSEKYFPKDDEVEMIRQFTNLTQGVDSVDAYAGKFERLSKFANHMFRDEKDRATKFLHGLSPELQKFMASHPPDTLRGAVSAARHQEKALVLDSCTRSASPKRVFSAMSRGHSSRSRNVKARSGGARPALSQAGMTRRQCYRCERRGHLSRDCLSGSGPCYECGAANHIHSDCPIGRQPPVGSSGRSQRQGSAAQSTSKGSQATLLNPQGIFHQGQDRG